RRYEPGHGIETPKLLQRLVVIGSDGAVEVGGHDETARRGQNTGVVRIRFLLAGFDLAGNGIEYDQRRGDTCLVAITSAAELSADVRGRIRDDVGAAFIAGDVDELCFRTERGRPEVRAAVHIGAGILEHVRAPLPADS